MSRKLPWFRMYGEAVDDDKLKLLAFEDRWHFVALLCCKTQGILDAQCDLEMMQRRIAVKLGVQTRELEEITRRLAEVGLVKWTRNRLEILAWDKRQFASDSSSDRVRKYRENRQKSGESDA